MIKNFPLWRWYCLALLVLLLNACSTFDYIPPTTDAGKQCVATCEVATQTCQAGARQAGALAKSLCESNKSNQLALCLSDAKTDDKRKSCQKRAKEYCGHGGAYGASGDCSASYDRCFTTCGGQIIERPD